MRIVVTASCSALLSLCLPGCKQLHLPAADTSHGAIAACEQATQKTLVSPASYHQVWAGFTEREPLNDEEQQEYNERHDCSAKREARGECTRDDLDRFTDVFTKNALDDMARRIKKGQKLTPLQQNIADARKRDAAEKLADPQAASTGFVTLEYDSANSYGAQLRSFGMCRFGPLGKDGKFEASDIFQSGPVPRDVGEEAKTVAQQLEDAEEQR